MAPQGKLPLSLKQYIVAFTLKLYLNKHARYNSYTTPYIKPSPCGPRGGDQATKDKLYYKQEFFY